MTTSRPDTVVIVDGDSKARDQLAALLSEQGSYHLVIHSTPSAALEYMQSHPIDMIISGYRLPEFSGLELLEHARTYHPDAPRILLTGHGGKESAIDGINRVGLFQYLEKPWDDERLLLTVRNGLRHKNMQRVLQEKIQALDSALLQLNEVSERNHILQQELHLARKVQQSLLSCPPEPAAGLQVHVIWQPALEIGGDFYDFLPLQSGATAIVLADATGHGIQAALMTALIKLALEEFRGSDASAADILAGMNNTLHKGLPQSMLVSALVVTIDPDSGACEAANAGIPHPLIAGKRQTTCVPANGVILGIFDQDNFPAPQVRRFTLGDDDQLVLFTDGLSEARNAEGRGFGEGMLQEALRKNGHKPPAGLAEYIIQNMRSFTGKDTRQQDDITLLTVALNRSKKH